MFTSQELTKLCLFELKPRRAGERESKLLVEDSKLVGIHWFGFQIHFNGFSFVRWKQLKVSSRLLGAVCCGIVGTQKEWKWTLLGWVKMRIRTKKDFNSMKNKSGNSFRSYWRQWPKSRATRKSTRVTVQYQKIEIFEKIEVFFTPKRLY